MAESEEQKALYYQSVYQQGYSNGHAPGRCQTQYKPVGGFQMFASHYQPAQRNWCLCPLLKQILFRFMPFFNPQIYEVPQNLQWGDVISDSKWV